LQCFLWDHFKIGVGEKGELWTKTSRHMTLKPRRLDVDMTSRR